MQLQPQTPEGIAMRGDSVNSKGVFLLFTDGKTQTFVGFTLQGEMGKKPAKPQGLSQKQLDARYSKERDKEPCRNAV
ncbi:MAG: hypothetical protein PUH91_06235 [Prevotella sp.]|nr:hypothetical protein [Prevotella sp.]